MTARCSKCHRPMNAASESGLGPVCARKAKARPIPAHERDLFGYDPCKAEIAACARLKVSIDSAAVMAHFAVRDGFNVARRALGVWS
jgi:hypothetical protein